MKLLALLVIFFHYFVEEASSTLLYKIISRSDYGDLRLTARKGYNLWDYGANQTYYTVSLWTPEIQNDDQEIRVALEWATIDGRENERVIFYGKVGEG